MSDYVFEMKNFNLDDQLRFDDGSLIWDTKDVLSIKYNINNREVEVLNKDDIILSFNATWVVPDGQLQLVFSNDKLEPKIHLEDDDLKFFIRCNEGEHLNNKLDES